MKTILYYISFLVTLNVTAQEPVKWSFSFNEATEQINISATIEDGWHIYSQHLKENSGPIATEIAFKESEGITLKGKTKEPKPMTEYDENFESQLSFFEKSVSFHQKIRSKNATSIKGTVTYMVCNTTMCLPPVDVPFEIKLK